jgi:rubrerythrin
MSEDAISICPVCNETRIKSRLKSPGMGNYVYLEMHLEVPETHDLLYVNVWVCPRCGRMELQALLPTLDEKKKRE